MSRLALLIMKKKFLIAGVFLLNQTLFAQNDFEVKVNKLIGYIKRNIHTSENLSDSNVIDFFVYDISIDSNGAISSVHTLILDSIKQATQIFKLAKSIKNNFFFNKPIYSKLLIPVQVNYNTDDELISKRDITILGTIKLFEDFPRYDIRNTFITRVVSINSFQAKLGSRLKSNNRHFN
jgi:hypothetical protein